MIVFTTFYLLFCGNTSQDVYQLLPKLQLLLKRGGAIPMLLHQQILVFLLLFT